MTRIGIIGLGYVGLPLAVAFAEAGEDVLGVDLDPRKAAAISEGRSYIEDVSSEALAAVTSSGHFRASTTPEGLRDRDAILICLPTPVDEHRNPDLRPVLAGAETAAAHIAPGALLVLESTTYPGTTREEIAPILERNGARIGHGCLPRLLARARRPRQRALRHPQHAQDRGRHDPRVHPPRRGAVRQDL